METIRITYDTHIAWVTIHRMQALNALSTQVLIELDQVLDEIDDNKDIYCVVITGAGDKSFVAGADIAEMMNKTVEEAAAYGAFGNAVFRKIETFRCPVIAAIQGFALGGGCELALSCDIRIASDRAIFGQPEVGLGITPGFGGTQRLARIIGVGLAKEMIYTGKHIDAQRAVQIGLVNAVVTQEEFISYVNNIALSIVKNAPIAVSYAKKAINEGLQLTIDQGIQKEVGLFAQCFATEDQTYGMQCFLHKEKHKQFSNK